jgi:aminopeptidase-like protein
MRNEMPMNGFGEEMYTWATDLFPLNRSLTGEGTHQTLKYIKNLLPDLEIKSIDSDEQVFDWIVPRVWSISAAYIKNVQGEILIDFNNSNLHVMGYSTPVSGLMTKEELSNHVYMLPDQPSAIPYVTSYYKEHWAFCMSLYQWESLGEGPFEILIDSKLDNGKMNYGEIYLPGKTEQEILFSSYVCHPSMANNELSGPVVLTKLMQEIKKDTNRHYSYRAILVPETIGSIVFLSRNLDQQKRDLVAGWVLTCLGDSGQFSYIPSRAGNTYADRVTLENFRQLGESFKEYTWLDRGSDERQFCAPGVDLPVCSVTKTKYGEYPEYHTSLDNLSVITSEALSKSLQFFLKLVELLEKNRTPKIATLGEPQLGKRNLYPNTSIKSNSNIRELMNVISFLDGRLNLKEIAERLQIPEADVLRIIEILEEHNLIK